MNGETTYDYTHFYFVMPADKMDVGLQIEADRMRNAALRSSGLGHRTRGGAQRTRRRRELAVFHPCSRRVRAAAYPGRAERTHAARKPRRRCACDGCGHRTLLSRMVRARTTPTLVVAGDVDHAAVFAKAQRYFGAIAAKELPARSQPATAPAVRGAVVESEIPFPFEVVDLSVRNSGRLPNRANRR